MLRAASLLVAGNIVLGLKVIGSGFGRTGTKSLKLALERALRTLPASALPLPCCSAVA